MPSTSVKFTVGPGVTNHWMTGRVRGVVVSETEIVGERWNAFLYISRPNTACHDGPSATAAPRRECFSFSNASKHMHSTWSTVNDAPACSSGTRQRSAMENLWTFAWSMLCAPGFKVPYTKDGPFWAIADGSCFLSPWQCHGGKSFCLVLPNNSEKIQSMARFKVKVLGSGMPRNDVPYMCCCLVI